MKFAVAALAAVGALGAALLSPAPAEARFFGGHALEAPSLVDTVQACRVRTVRTVRNGRVVVRTVRDCGSRAGRAVVAPRIVIRPGFIGNRGCRNVTTRVRTGNRVVVRTVRRC